MLKSHFPDNRRKAILFFSAICFTLSAILFISSGIAVKDTKSSGKVYHLTIDSVYDPIMSNYITRSVKLAEEDNAELIIIELNTPGGMVGSMMEINDALLRSSVPTIAWVHKDAASAGGATVIACGNIVMSRGATFGAVVPVVMGPFGPIELGPKYISYMRKQMAAAAEANGYHPLLAAAMTDKRIEISYLEYWEWALENKDEFIKRGFKVDDIPEKIRYYREMEKRLSEEWKTKAGTATPPETEPSPVDISLREILRTLSGSESDEDFGIQPRDRDWRDEPGVKWFITTRAEPVTLSTKDALELKMALAEVNTIRDIFNLDKYSHLKDAQIISANRSWSEDFAKFLQPLAGWLLIGGIIAISVEMRIPGFGVPGILGIICLSLFFFSNFGYTMADWIHIALFLVGIVLLAIELFVIPGFGVVGITGIILMLLGLFMTILKKPIPDLPVPRIAIGVTLVRLGIYLIVSIVVLILLFRYVIAYTPIYGKIVLSDRQDTKLGYHASEGTPLAMGDELIGKKGVAHSFLRPAGKAVFDGKLFDVVTEGDFIDKDEEIHITEVKGNRIVVKRTKTTT